METITTQMGTLGGLLTATADFFGPTDEDEEGFIRPLDLPEPYLSGVPCMPATGRNTRQDGVVAVALMGSLSFETKWSAINLTTETRNLIAEDDRITITQRDRSGDILSAGTYIIAGITEYDAPELGFAFAILSLKEKK